MIYYVCCVCGSFQLRGRGRGRGRKWTVEQISSDTERKKKRENASGPLRTAVVLIETERESEAGEKKIGIFFTLVRTTGINRGIIAGARVGGGKRGQDATTIAGGREGKRKDREGGGEKEIGIREVLFLLVRLNRTGEGCRGRERVRDGRRDWR